MSSQLYSNIVVNDCNGKYGWSRWWWWNRSFLENICVRSYR